MVATTWVIIETEWKHNFCNFVACQNRLVRTLTRFDFRSTILWRARIKVWYSMCPGTLTLFRAVRATWPFWGITNSYFIGVRLCTTCRWWCQAFIRSKWPFTQTIRPHFVAAVTSYHSSVPFTFWLYHWREKGDCCCAFEAGSQWNLKRNSLLQKRFSFGLIYFKFKFSPYSGPPGLQPLSKNSVGSFHEMPQLWPHWPTPWHARGSGARSTTHFVAVCCGAVCFQGAVYVRQWSAGYYGTCVCSGAEIRSFLRLHYKSSAVQQCKRKRHRPSLPSSQCIVPIKEWLELFPSF